MCYVAIRCSFSAKSVIIQISVSPNNIKIVLKVCNLVDHNLATGMGNPN